MSINEIVLIVALTLTGCRQQPEPTAHQVVESQKVDPPNTAEILTLDVDSTRVPK